MKVKTAELICVQLDYAVAMSVENPVKVIRGEVCSMHEEGNEWMPYAYFNPSTDWGVCGAFIEKFQIFIEPPHEIHKSMVDSNGKPKGCWESFDTWHTTISTRVAEKPKKHLWADFSLPGGPYRGEGETPQIAICRAVVASKLGDEVDIPDELMESK